VIGMVVAGGVICVTLGPAASGDLRHAPAGQE